MNPYPFLVSPNDICNVAFQSNIRATTRLSDNISKALKCSTELNDLSTNNGTKLVYPTTYILQLADKANQHPLFHTISCQLRRLYDLVKYERTCPDWITPQLHAIEQKMQSLLPNDNDIIEIISKSPKKSPKKKSAKSPKKKNKKCKAITHNIKNSQKEIKKSSPHGRQSKRCVYRGYHQKHFNDLYKKIDSIESKMDQLGQTLNGKLGGIKKKVKKSNKKKSNRKRTSYNANKRKSAKLLKKINKLESLQSAAQKAVQNMGSSASGSEIHIPTISSHDGNGSNEWRKQIQDKDAFIKSLQKQLEEMRRKESAIYDLTMEIRDKSLDV